MFQVCVWAGSAENCWRALLSRMVDKDRVGGQCDRIGADLISRSRPRKGDEDGMDGGGESGRESKSKRKKRHQRHPIRRRVS